MMKRSIWKYQFSGVDDLQTQMPFGSRVVHVAEQGGEITLWSEVDPHAPTGYETRRFTIRGTGHEFDSTGLNYVGSVLCGKFVWHVYEVNQ